MESFISFMSPFINKSSTVVVKQLIQYHNTWDLYALALLFLKIIVSKFSTQSNSETNFIYPLLVQIFLLNLSPYPSKRPSFQQLKELLFNSFKDQSNNFNNIQFKLSKENLATVPKNFNKSLVFF